MYKNILIPVENSPTDQIILAHVREMGKVFGSRLTFVHVADGFVARNQQMFNLSDSDEMIRDREYLEHLRKEFSTSGFQVEVLLKCGDPTDKILEVASEKNCDLIAMSTHGHRFLGDFLFGTVASQVRHRTNIPVLLLKAPRPAKG